MANEMVLLTQQIKDITEQLKAIRTANPEALPVEELKKGEQKIKERLIEIGNRVEILKQQELAIAVGCRSHM